MEFGLIDAIWLMAAGYSLLVVSWGLAFGYWFFPLHFLNKRRVSKAKRKVERDEANRRAAYYRELNRLKKQKDALGIIELLKKEELPDHAIRALGELKDPAAVGTLIKELEIGRVHFLWVIDALKKIGNPSIEPMTRALLDERLSLDVRKELIVLLGNMKATDAIDSIINLLKIERKEAIRNASFKALKRITGISFGDNLEKWSEWWEQSRD